MKKVQRVLKNQEFSRIIHKRQSAACSAFVLYHQPRNQTHARVGISVGKKIGNAVIRTKTKRQMRALIDSVFTYDEPFDTILIVRPAFAKLDHQERFDMLVRLHDKALHQYSGGRL